MIRQFWNYYKFPEELSFTAILAVVLRRFLLFFAVIMANFLLAGFFLLLKGGSIWLVMAFVLIICLIVGIIVNKRSKRFAGPILRWILQAAGALWLVIETGQVVKSHISWEPDAFFWAFWVSLLSTVALGTYALDAYVNMQHSNTPDTKEQAMLRIK